MREPTSLTPMLLLRPVGFPTPYSILLPKSIIFILLTLDLTPLLKPIVFVSITPPLPAAPYKVQT